MLGQWITDRCMTEIEGLSERAGRLYEDFRRASEAAGEVPTKLRRFGEELKARGFRREHTRDGSRWFGIALRTVIDCEDES